MSVFLEFYGEELTQTNNTLRRKNIQTGNNLHASIFYFLFKKINKIELSCRTVFHLHGFLSCLLRFGVVSEWILSVIDLVLVAVCPPLDSDPKSPSLPLVWSSSGWGAGIDVRVPDNSVVPFSDSEQRERCRSLGRISPFFGCLLFTLADGITSVILSIARVSYLCPKFLTNLRIYSPSATVRHHLFGF